MKREGKWGVPHTTACLRAAHSLQDCFLPAHLLSARQLLNAEPLKFSTSFAASHMVNFTGTVYLFICRAPQGGAEEGWKLICCIWEVGRRRGEPPREGGRAPANLTAEENNLIRVIWKIG